MVEGNGDAPLPLGPQALCAPEQSDEAAEPGNCALFKVTPV
jgi:hypothetical protein